MIPSHPLRAYNYILNKSSLHLFFQKYIQRSYPRFIFENLRNKLRNLKRGKPTDFFLSVLIETCSICNRKCWYCPNTKFKRPTKLMPEELFYKIIDDLAKVNYSGVVAPHFFNEPLADNRLPTFIRYIRKKLPKSRIILYTNGDLLTIEKFKELIKDGVNIFEVTEHDEKPSEIILKLFSFLKKNPSFKKYLNYRKNLYLENRAGLIDIKQKQKPRCTSSLYNITINYEGKMVLCCQDYFGEVVLGDVKKENLIQIWNKPFYKKIRENNKKGIFNLELCKKCISCNN